MKSVLKKTGIGSAVLLFWLAVWELGSLAVGYRLLLPSPLAVLSRLVLLAGQGDFWITVLYSIMRVLLGILLAVVLGVVLALCTCRFPPIRMLVSPLLTVIKATPVASFIILALLWLGSSRLPVLIGGLIVLPVVWAAVSDGIEALDRELDEVCTVFQFSKGKKLRLLLLPSIKPYFLSALRTSVGMAWKAGVAAEILAVSPVSIGKQLYNAKIYLETEELFAWTLVVIVLSVLVEKVLGVLLRNIGYRRFRRKEYAEN